MKKNVKKSVCMCIPAPLCCTAELRQWGLLWGLSDEDSA